MNKMKMKTCMMTLAGLVLAMAASAQNFVMKGKVKGNVDGCDPRYSFHFTGQGDTVYVVEAPSDLLSFRSLYQTDWQRHS